MPWLKTTASLSVCATVFAIFLLCLPSLFHVDSNSVTRALGSRAARYEIRHGRSVVRAVDQSWRDKIIPGPAHQDPAQAPPQPLPNITKDEVVIDNSVSANPRDLHTLSRRDGPLRCDDGPCIDKSCCGKDNICGYGPDYCGTGCKSQCDAVAMCGEYSEDGDMPCGMRLCCSAMGWCGTTDIYCKNADPAHKTLPCQAGYGACAITGSPSCSEGSGSSNGRTIGYYQSWNIRERKCNRVAPRQLNTAGYTHLFYAFAYIDPTSFKITTAHQDDDTMMRDFTSLSKGGKLQTWLAVGGFDFSNPDTPTHMTWSDMVASKGTRATFISSVDAFLAKYGFQGIDLDWEYPGAEERGGRKMADVRNFAALVREMRAAFGTRYGISVTLAPDYWYLRWFDAKAMESSVDFFGFMAYDLHGSWDADVKTLGKKVRGQADIREIKADTVPLWFDGLNPQKINFGLAMYGRGYTLADKSCSDLLCPFAGPSKPAPCTNFDGVMSLVEIKQLIKQKGLTPKYLPDAMMKQITWDDQWIGYDDEETFAAKKAVANGLCFGGTMVWSIDFQVAGSGGPKGDPVYLDPTIYKGEPAECTAPCVFVLPPSTLGSPTTISIPPYTTSIQLSPDETETITITISAVTTTIIDYYNIQLTTGARDSQTITPLVSIDLPRVTTILTDNGGNKQTRTLTLPPWPLITHGPPEGWSDDEDPDQPTNTGISGSQGGGGGSTRSQFPPIVKPTPTTFPETQKPAYTPVPDENPTPSPTFPEDSEIKPLETPVDDDGEDDDGPDPHYKTTCRLWFFFICIDWNDIDIHLRGWDWNFPVGIWGPGPPNFHIDWPPGFTLKGELPPWPKITVHPGGKVDYPDEPENCTPKSASLCSTTTSFGTTVSQGVTKTTTTKVQSTCATITGCEVQDSEATQTQVGGSCAPRRRQVAPRTAAAALPEVTDAPQKRAPNNNAPAWQCDPGLDATVIILRNAEDPGSRSETINLLQARYNDLASLGLANQGYWHEIRANTLGFTAFFYLDALGTEGLKFFNSAEVPTVEYAYHIGKGPMLNGGFPRRDLNLANDYIVEQQPQSTDSMSNSTTLADERMRLAKRDTMREPTEYWYLSQISIPRGIDFTAVNVDAGHYPDERKFAYFYESDPGEGQTIYIIDSGWLDNHEAYAYTNPQFLPPRTWGPQQIFTRGDLEHGHLGACVAAGHDGGIAREAQIVMGTFLINTAYSAETVLDTLTTIANDLPNRRKNTCVINMSFLLTGYDPNHPIFTPMLTLMYLMERDYGVVFVVSAGNSPGPVTANPAIMTKYLAGMLVVGATSENGLAWESSASGDLVDVWAPGEGIPLPDLANLQVYGQEDGTGSGTSLAAPLVAGLVAYTRESPYYGGDGTPGDVLSYLKSIVRPINYGGETGELEAVWNDSRWPTNCNAPGNNNNKRDSCPNPGNPPGNPTGNPPGGGGGEGPGTSGPPFVFQPGPPGPICKANCGHVCDGFYCDTDPIGTPPDYFPAIPGYPGGEQPTGTGGSGGGGSGGAPYTGTDCSTYSHTTICNGGNCKAQDLCVPTAACLPSYTPKGTPTCTDPAYPSCLVTTMFTRCARVDPGPTGGAAARARRWESESHRAPITTAAATLTADSSLETQSLLDSELESFRDEEQFQIQQIDLAELLWAHDQVLIETTTNAVVKPQHPQSRNPLAVFARAEACGGSANGGCDYIPACKVCVGKVNVPCLEATIDVTTGIFDGTVTKATVKQNGEVVCQANAQCKPFEVISPQCIGVDDLDCGNGNRMSWSLNFIIFSSDQYGTNFPLYLSPIIEGEPTLCNQGGNIPSICLHDSLGIKEGPCND